jgi:apolipoprotein D and lipocalin family protein
MSMKKIFSIAMLLLFSAPVYAQGLFPAVVPNLDTERFLGRWFEVASTKPGFQKDCVCVTADYIPRDAKSIGVVNSCRKLSPEGELEVVVGSAKTTRNPAKLNVSFGGFSLPFSNYWVVDLADDYSYAVISTPFRNPIWVLSSTPEINPDVLDGIYSRLSAAGFNASSISPTLQLGCSYEAIAE